MKENMTIVNYSRKIPLTHDVDVLVVGGGIAGVCAACAAAKEGMDVLLVERFSILGGNGTSGGIRGFCGETLGQGQVFDEIINDLERFNAVKPRMENRSFFYARGYDHAILAVILQELVLRHGVTLLLHARFVDAIATKSRVEYALVTGKSGLQMIKAKLFIDCTGDSDVCVAAGLETMKGREKDGVQLPMSLIFFVRKHGYFGKKMHIPPGFFQWEPFTEKDQLPMTSFTPIGSRGKSVKIKVPKFDSTDTFELSRAEIEGRRKMMQVMHYYQVKKGKNWNLDHCSSIIGIREGRRVVGEYILTLRDVRRGSVFKDAIAVGTFPLDAHKPDDDKRTYILSREEMAVPPYQIPLRCLIPKGMKNLMVAGRNLSADQLALSSARVMATCAAMGQSAGITAHMCIEKKTDPLDISKNMYRELETRLQEAGLKLSLEFYRDKI
jgi:ribulose 1,5-bisphosphate synthetase/thiazole synthase